MCAFGTHKKRKERMPVRTTIELDDNLLQEAMTVTGAKKKRHLIELALHEIIRRQRIERLIQRLGKTPLALTATDLQRMRRED